MAQSIYLAEEFTDKTIHFTPPFPSDSVWKVLPNGGIAVVTRIVSDVVTTLSLSQYSPDGEQVGETETLAAVPRGNGLIDFSFVEDASGRVAFHYKVVTGTSHSRVHQLLAGDDVETELRVVRLTDDGALDGTQILANWTGYIPSVHLTVLTDGGLAMLYSGEPKDLITWPPVLGGYSSSTVPDPDSLLQLFDSDGNPVGEPATWANSGYGVLDSDIGYGSGGGGPEVLQLIKLYARPDGTVLVILPELFDPGVYGYDSEVSPAFLHSYVLRADGTLSARNTLFENPIDDPRADILERNGDIGAWQIVTLGDGSTALLSERFTNAGERPDGSLNYYTSLILQPLDENGGLTGEARELMRVDDAYTRSIQVLDAESNVDGDFVLLTWSSQSGVNTHIVPADGSEIVTMRLSIVSDEIAEDMTFGYPLSAEIRADGGVTILRSEQTRTPDGEREYSLSLSSFAADGQSEGPNVPLTDERDIYLHQLSVSPEGLITVVWDNSGDAGTPFVGRFIDGAAFSVLSPRLLTDEADIETLDSPEFIDGAGGNDTLTGSDEDDRLIGGDGNDLLSGQLGNDLFQGGSGDDTIHGSAGMDTAFWAGRWQDYIADVINEADTPEDLRDMGPVYVIEGQDDRSVDGRDLILSIEKLVFANGHITPDELVTHTLRERLNDLLEGTPGENDTLNGGLGDDTLWGLDGDDSLSGGEDTDLLEGGSGNDTLVGGDGQDVLVGRDGLDAAVFSGNWQDYEFAFSRNERFPTVPEIPIELARRDQAIVVTARAGASGDDEIDFLFDIENLVFADRSDSAYQILLDAGTYDLSLHGWRDAEILMGDIGHDQIDGDAGNDTIYGGPGHDTLNGALGDDSVVGGLGDDALYGQAGIDVLDGLEGDDFADGGDGNDIVRGHQGDDYLFGRVGNDTVNGGSGSDTINGGSGDDLIIGGDDVPGADLFDLILAGEGNDHVLAGAGNDQVFGQEGDDRILGGFGADTLVGQDGNDTITGGALSDMIFGSDGNDFVNGGFGHDRINGGSGADQFFHVGVLGHGSDWVQDYSASDGDVLMWGGEPAVKDDFQINLAHTSNPAGERSGDDAMQEAFVIYKPTEQIIWALVDGGGQSSINLQIGGETFDLLT